MVRTLDGCDCMKIINFIIRTHCQTSNVFLSTHEKNNVNFRLYSEKRYLCRIHYIVCNNEILNSISNIYSSIRNSITHANQLILYHRYDCPGLSEECRRCCNPHIPKRHDPIVALDTNFLAIMQQEGCMNKKVLIWF